MQTKLIILILIIVQFSCNNIPESTGQSNEITIIMSNEDREYVELEFLDILKKNIYTPIKENLYEINIVNPESFKFNKYKKNIILISLKYPEDSTSDLLYNKFYDIYDDQSIFSLNDLYAKNQLFLCFGSHDATKLSIDVENYKDWILSEINLNIEKNIIYHLHQYKQENNIASYIKVNFNVDIFIDENYKIIKQSDSFFWIGRGYPYRWIIFNEIKKNTNSKIDYIDTIKEVFENKLTNVIISDYKLNQFIEDNQIIIRGVYEQKDSDTGGPFFTYIFENISNNKVIFISGFVNNPGNKKAALLLQLETIIKNIGEI